MSQANGGSLVGCLRQVAKTSFMFPSPGAGNSLRHSRVGYWRSTYVAVGARFVAQALEVASLATTRTP